MKLRSAFLLLAALAVTATASAHPEPSSFVAPASSCELVTPISEQDTIAAAECALLAAVLQASANTSGMSRAGQRAVASSRNLHDTPSHDCPALLGARCELDAAKYGRYGPSPTTIPPPVL